MPALIEKTQMSVCVESQKEDIHDGKTSEALWYGTSGLFALSPVTSVVAVS